MSDTQQAMVLLLSVFEKYAGKDGDCNTLSKSELKDLLQSELRELLGKANDKAAVEKIFNDLDRNGDSLVDFKEFGTLVLSLTVMCHEFMKSKK